jgi:hypothetical protein
MKARKRRERRMMRQQKIFRDNDLRLSTIHEKAKKEIDTHHNAMRILEEQKDRERSIRLEQERKKKEQEKKVEAAKKKVDQYKEMGYTELRKVAKELEISIYRRKKDDILNEILMKVGQESNDPEDSHKPLRTQNVV